ncbi:MAG: hypothetical protein ABGZ17_03480 [Planctomycetaceae bacterium]
MDGTAEPSVRCRTAAVPHRRLDGIPQAGLMLRAREHYHQSPDINGTSQALPVGRRRVAELEVLLRCFSVITAVVLVKDVVAEFLRGSTR